MKNFIGRIGPYYRFDTNIDSIKQFNRFSIANINFIFESNSNIPLGNNPKIDLAFKHKPFINN